MQTNDINNKGSTDKTQKIKDWLNDHGHPSYEYLQSLARDANPGSLEKLRAIAEDLDLNFNPDISPQELIDAIRKAAEDVPDKFTS
jgi:hypothetical protein